VGEVAPVGNRPERASIGSGRPLYDATAGMPMLRVDDRRRGRLIPRRCRGISSTTGTTSTCSG